ncbi:MAG: hypothetical protein ACT4PT_03540 [Methanobacteriota archaeon]
MDVAELPSPVRERLERAAGERLSEIAKVRMIDGGSHWFLVFYPKTAPATSTLAPISDALRREGIATTLDAERLVVPYWRKPGAIGDA